MDNNPICPTSTATILACQSISKSFKEHIFELSRIRPEWDIKYATSLRIWIDDIIIKYYSHTSGQLKEEKYQNWHEIMIGAIKYLGTLRATVKVDFKNDKEFKKEFFQKFGYNDFYSDAKNGDHLSTYNLLKTFAGNLDEKTRKKLEDKGDEKSIIDHILDFAEQINAYKECFELMKGNNEVNVYGKKDIDEIYNSIKDICRIAGAYYQFDPDVREKFNFYRVLRNL